MSSSEYPDYSVIQNNRDTLNTQNKKSLNMKDLNPNKNFGLDSKPSLRDIGKLALIVGAAIAGTLFGSLLTKGGKKK